MWVVMGCVTCRIWAVVQVTVMSGAVSCINRYRGEIKWRIVVIVV
jgi:hypothetical protein